MGFARGAVSTIFECAVGRAHAEEGDWILDAESFFDNLSYEWMIKFIEHRIADRRLVRLIRKWMRAESPRQWWRTEVGSRKDR